MQLFYIDYYISVPYLKMYFKLSWKALFIELVLFLLLYLFSAIACNLVICRKDV